MKLITITNSNNKVNKQWQPRGKIDKRQLTQKRMKEISFIV